MGPVPGHNWAFKLIEKVNVRRIARQSVIPAFKGRSHPVSFELQHFNCFLIKNDFIKKFFR
jgi:hypothetical protein